MSYQEDSFLDEQLDWLTVDHDDLRKDILEQISTPKYHPSMRVIDQWERDAIARIRYTAVFARRTLIDALDQHAFEASKTLNILTPILDQARQHIRSFDENDIQKWANILHELKQTPIFPVTIDKNNTIHGLTINLEKQQTASLHSEPILHSLVTIIHEPIPSIHAAKQSKYQPTYDSRKSVKFNDVSLIGNSADYHIRKNCYYSRAAKESRHYSAHPISK